MAVQVATRNTLESQQPKGADSGTQGGGAVSGNGGGFAPAAPRMDQHTSLSAWRAMDAQAQAGRVSASSLRPA